MATVGFLSTNAYVLVDNTATFSISANKLTANNPMSLTVGSLFNVGISTYDENSDTFSDFLTIIVTDNPVFSLDIDGNGTLAAPNDGLIIFKYLLNSNANNLHTSIANGATRKTTAQLKVYLDAFR